MESKFLRKIILEELKKVLEEQEEEAGGIPAPSQMDLLYKYLLNKATEKCGDSEDFAACSRRRETFRMRIISTRPGIQSVIDFSKNLYKSNKYTNTEDLASLGTVLTKLKDTLS